MPQHARRREQYMRKTEKAKHQVITYPSARVTTMDLGSIALRKHHVVGLIEVDVTEARSRLREERSAESGVSFFAWIVKTVAAVIAENRYIQAVAGGKNRLVVFDDVDISVVVEREVAGTRVPLPTLIRKADKKTGKEIFDEIRQAQIRKIEDEGDYVLSGRGVSRGLLKLYYLVPRFLRLAAFRYILANPFIRKKIMGTVVITSIGAARGLAGWILPKTMHTVCIGLGSITKKPWVVSGEILPRDILHMTVLIDHDVVDGVPAARFTADLVDRISKPRN